MGNNHDSCLTSTRALDLLVDLLDAVEMRADDAPDDVGCVICLAKTEAACDDDCPAHRSRALVTEIMNR